MTTFDERERAYEKKFSMDQEFMFKAQARCNKLLGEWAAARLGLSPAARGDYVKAVIKAGLAGTGASALSKVKQDLQDCGASVTDNELRTTMTEFLRTAVRQIEDAGAGGNR
jgi:hypothetical protein